MSWGEVKKINSDLKVPLNHLIWLNDYKTYGVNSYVFQNKDMLHELYRDYRLSINDKAIRKEAIQFAESIGETGLAISYQYDSDLSSVSEYSTFDEINQSGNIRFLEETYLDGCLLQWLFDDGLLDESFYLSKNMYILLEQSNKEVATLIKDAVVNAWYTDYYNEISSGIDAAITVYNFGGKLWAKCQNQTYSKAIYDHENSNGNIRTISGYTAGSAGTNTTIGVLSNVKAILCVRIAKGNCGYNDWDGYVYANATRNGNVISGSFLHNSQYYKSFESGNGFSGCGDLNEAYGIYPCEHVEGIAGTYGNNTGVLCTISVV